MIREISRKCASGYLALVVLPGLHILDGWLFYRAVSAQNVGGTIFTVLMGIVILICYKGFFMVHPNQSKVLQLFGTYVGSVRETGLRWANPARVPAGDRSTGPGLRGAWTRPSTGQRGSGISPR